MDTYTVRWDVVSNSYRVVKNDDEVIEVFTGPRAVTQAFEKAKELTPK